MKIAIFGATGSVGIHLVKQGLQAGHQVTAFVRNPSKMRVKHENLRVIQGDVLSDHRQIEEAVAGQDAVLITLGAGLRGKVRAVGTQNVIRVMQRHGVDRLICQSTLGAGDSVNNLNFKWRFLFRVPLRMAMADHERQEKWVRESGLAWTIVRPSSFTDEPLSGNYEHGFSGNIRNLNLTVARADVAHFMLSQLNQKQYDRCEVSLSC